MGDLKTTIDTWKDLNSQIKVLKKNKKAIDNEYKSKMYPIKQKIFEIQTQMNDLTKPIYTYMKENDIDDIESDKSIIRYSISTRGPSLSKDAIKIRLLEHFKDNGAVENMMNIILDEKDSVQTVKLKCIAAKKK